MTKITHSNNGTGGGHEQQRMTTATALDGGMLDSGVGCMSDNGALTGGMSDSPDIYTGATSTGWQHSGLESRGIGSNVQGGLIARCIAISPQRCWEVVMVQCHPTAAEDSGNLV
jgi:hypothetical protein